MTTTQRKPVIEYFSGSANTTKTVNGHATGFGIVNDGSSDLTFTINGLTITVKIGETFDDDFPYFESVTVTTTGAFRGWIRG